jgi:hypothetical protein
MYYMPALVRLTLETMEDPREDYLDQLLFHLVYDGPNNRLVSACSKEQREFVADFLEYLMETYCSQIDERVFTSDELLKAHEIWRAGMTKGC